METVSPHELLSFFLPGRLLLETWGYLEVSAFFSKMFWAPLSSSSCKSKAWSSTSYACVASTCELLEVRGQGEGKPRVTRGPGAVGERWTLLNEITVVSHNDDTWPLGHPALFFFPLHPEPHKDAVMKRWPWAPLLNKSHKDRCLVGELCKSSCTALVISLSASYCPEEAIFLFHS